MGAQHDEIALADSDEVALLRRRARRRLIGAIALVVFAVIALPIILDEEPKPVGQDIVIQIPSQTGSKFNPKIPEPPPIDPPKAEAKPEPKAEAKPPAAPSEASPESKGVAAKGAITESASRVDTPVVPKAATSAVDAKLLADAKDPSGKSAPKADAKADARPAGDKDAKAPAKAVAKAEATAESRSEPKAEPKSDTKSASAKAEGARAQGADGEGYIVPLGAFLNQANVKALQAKVTLAGFKSYSEVQTTPKGEQIRVRAGPFPTKEAAEKAREQLKAGGLTVGPVAKL